MTYVIANIVKETNICEVLWRKLNFSALYARNVLYRAEFFLYTSFQHVLIKITLQEYLLYFVMLQTIA